MAGFKPIERLYTIDNLGPIKCLGGICGPITTPTKLNDSDVILLLKDNYKVYQHNPYNYDEKERVTRSNFSNITFKTTKAEATKKKIMNEQILKMEKETIVDVVRKSPEPVSKDHSKEQKKSDQKNEVKVTSNEKKVVEADNFTV